MSLYAFIVTQAMQHLSFFPLECDRNAEFSSHRENVFSRLQIDFFTCDLINLLLGHFIAPSILTIKVQFSGEITFTHLLRLSSLPRRGSQHLQTNFHFTHRFDEGKKPWHTSFSGDEHTIGRLSFSPFLPSSEKIQWVIRYSRRPGRCCSHSSLRILTAHFLVVVSIVTDQWSSLGKDYRCTNNNE